MSYFKSSKRKKEKYLFIRCDVVIHKVSLNTMQLDVAEVQMNIRKKSGALSCCSSLEKHNVQNAFAISIIIALLSS